MPHLTADQILSANIKFIDVEIEDWGGDIRLRDISAKKKLELLPLFQDESATKLDKMFALLVECIVDPETNEPLFNNGRRAEFEDSFSDVDLLNKLFDKAIVFMGMPQSDAIKKK